MRNPRLEACKDGSCRGVLDTGTSHLGVPAPFDKDRRPKPEACDAKLCHQDLERRLKQDAGDLLDCRNAQAPQLDIELFEGKA